MNIYGVFNNGVPLSKTPIPNSYAYEVVTPRVALPLTLAELKSHLRLDPADTSDDAYLTLIINAVADYFEKYTNRTLINTVFKTYRDKFSSYGCFTLRKSKVNPSSVTINYLKNNVLIPVSSADYYVTSETGFPTINLYEGKFWPNDADNRAQAIVIQFTAGYGTSNTAIPSDIKIALLNHSSALFENRGDCSNDACANTLPMGAKKTYDQYIIYSLSPYELCRVC